MRNAELDLGEVSLEEPPRRRRDRSRRWPLALVAVAVLAAVTLALGTGDGGPDRPDPTPTTVVPRPGRDLVVYSPRLLDDVVVIGAPVGYGATGSLASIDPAAATVQRRDRDVHLWPGDFQLPMAVIGERLVWVDGTVAWSMPADLSADPVSMGKASGLVPALGAQTVWVHRADGTIAEVGSDGAVHRDGVVPDGAAPVAEVDGGLLLRTGTDLVVWDPSSDEQRRVHGAATVLATAATRALLDDGTLVDLTTGDASKLPYFESFADAQLVAGAFSPDGTWLALFTIRPESRDAGIQLLRLGTDPLEELGSQFHQLLSVRTLVWHRLVWSADGDAVYAMTSASSTGDRIVGIPLGGSPQTVATLDQNGWYWLAVG